MFYGLYANNTRAALVVDPGLDDSKTIRLTHYGFLKNNNSALKAFKVFTKRRYLCCESLQ